MAVKNFIASGLLTNDFSTPLANQISLYENRLTEFTLEYASEEREVPGIVDGSDIVQTLDSYLTSETYTLTTTTESIDSQLLALLVGESWALTDSYSAKDFFRATVPADLTIEDDRILTGFGVADIQVTIVQGSATVGRPRPLSITTSTATADSVQLDAANNALIFHSSHAGAAVKVSPKTTYTNKYTLGYEQDYGSLTNLQFVGIASLTSGRAGAGTNRILIHVPQLSKSGGWTLGIGAESSVDLSFKCIVSGANRKPVIFVEL